MEDSMNIKLLVMDVDGTLTDGKIHIGLDGEVFKSFHVKDGYGIKEILPETGITPIIITGRSSLFLEKRANELGIKEVYQGIKNKLELLREICNNKDISFSQIAYIGDDLNDFEVMKLVAIKGCPSDAVSKIKEICDFVSEKKGGDGSVREFIDWICDYNKV